MYWVCNDQYNKEVRKHDSNHLPALAIESQLAIWVRIQLLIKSTRFNLKSKTNTLYPKVGIKSAAFASVPMVSSDGKHYIPYGRKLWRRKRWQIWRMTINSPNFPQPNFMLQIDLEYNIDFEMECPRLDERLEPSSSRT